MGMQTAVAFKVHVATQVMLKSHSSSLARLCDRVWQSVRIRKMVVFTDGSGMSSPPIDVTGTDYDFGIEIQGGPGVASYDPRTGFATGIGPGSATLVPLVAGMGRSITGMSITVQSTESNGGFTGISMFTYKSVIWDDQGVRPTFVDSDTLRLETDWQIIAPVVMPDGHFVQSLQLRAAMGASGAIVSSNPTLYTVSEPADGCGEAGCPYRVGGIAKEAYSKAAGQRAQVQIQSSQWIPGCQTTPWNVNVSVPSVTSARLVLHDGLVGSSGFTMAASTLDGAHELYSTKSPPITFELTLDTPVPKTIQVALDPQGTIFHLHGSQAPSIYTFAAAGPSDSSVGSVPAEAIALSGVAQGPAVFNITATAFTGAITSSNTITVTLATATSLSLAATKVTGAHSQPGNGALLKAIGCGSFKIWQTARVTGILQLSNGASVTTSAVSYSCPAQSVLTCSADGFVVPVGVPKGTTSTGNVQGSYKTLSSTISISVMGVGVPITAAHLSLPQTTTNRNQTTGRLALELVLQDGTTIDDWFDTVPGHPAALVRDQLHSLVTVSSSQPQALRVNPLTGVYTLLQNSVGQMLVSALPASTMVCHTGVLPVSASTHVNLLPEPVDVDLGENLANQAPVPDLRVNARVPITVTSGGNSILDVRVSITFDPNAVEVTACDLSTMAKKFLYVDCTLDEHPGEVVLTAITLAPGVSNPSDLAGMQLGTITLAPLAGYNSNGALAPSMLRARVTALKAGPLECGDAPRAACPHTVAGQAVPVFAPYTRTVAAVVGRINDIRPMSTAAGRKLLGAREYVRGDVNGDGTFDQDDIRFATEFYNFADPLGCASTKGCQARSTLAANQLRALSPIHDPLDTSGVRDTGHLFTILTGKSRFVENLTVSTEPSSMRLAVAVIGSDSLPDVHADRLKVWFTLNATKDVLQARGHSTTYTNNRTVVEAVHVGQGLYEATLSTLGNSSNVAATVTVSRLNTYLQASPARTVHFFDNSTTAFRPVITGIQLVHKDPIKGSVAKNVTIAANQSHTIGISGGGYVLIRPGTLDIDGFVEVMENFTYPADITNISKSSAIGSILTIQSSQSIRQPITVVQYVRAAEGQRRLLQVQPPGCTMLMVVHNKSQNRWRRLVEQVYDGSSITGNVQQTDLAPPDLKVRVAQVCTNDTTLFDPVVNPVPTTTPPPSPTPEPQPTVLPINFAMIAGVVVAIVVVGLVAVIVSSRKHAQKVHFSHVPPATGIKAEIVPTVPNIDHWFKVSLSNRGNLQDSNP